MKTPALSGFRSGLALAACIAASFSVGAIGVLFSGSGVKDWYPTLAKPSWTPPGRLFGPVWSLLYFMMGVAAWRVWRRDGFRKARLALGVDVLQLVLNGAWSGIFFGLRQPAVAFVEILALWLFIVATTYLFWMRDRLAGILMILYLAWVSFATVLNGAIAWMNRS